MKKLFKLFMIYVIGRVNWTGLSYFITGKEYKLTNDDVKKLADYMLKERVVGISARNTHLSTLMATLGHFILTRRWLWVGHAFINVDDEQSDPFGMQIFESVGAGAIVSPFWKVILCDYVWLGKPKYVKESDWEKIHQVLLSQQGIVYDIFCNPRDASALNCVERVVLAILTVDPTALPSLSRMMEKYGNLTPQMVIECGDFEVCLEIKR